MKGCPASMSPHFAKTTPTLWSDAESPSFREQNVTRAFSYCPASYWKTPGSKSQGMRLGMPLNRVQGLTRKIRESPLRRRNPYPRFSAAPRVIVKAIERLPALPSAQPSEALRSSKY